MKTIRLSLFAAWLISLTPASAQPAADGLVAAGRNHLVAHHLILADAKFNAALVLAPDHEIANVLAAATRLLILPQRPAGSNFLNRLGITASGRDLYNWTADYRHDTNHHQPILPANLKSTEALAYISNNVLPAIHASLTNLARVTHPGFVLPLSEEETAMEAVTLDYGDVLLLRALLHAADALGHTLNAHNFDVVLNHIYDLAKAEQLTLQRLLQDYPKLLAKVSSSDLLASRLAFVRASDAYFAASQFIRTQRPANAERLFTLVDEDLEKEETFRENLTKAVASLDAPVQVDTNSLTAVYAGAYFAGLTPLRSLVPKFQGNAYVYNSLPDYTFGGVFLEQPAWKTEAFLRKYLAPTSEGIYLGQFTSYDVFAGWQLRGRCALFVRTNQQMTLLGFDQVAEQAVWGETIVDEDGDWEWQTNGVYSTGEIYHDGWVEGNLDYFGGSLYLNADVRTEPGPFQSAAGYYAGTWTGTGSSGKLRSILSDDGQLIYVEFESNGHAGDGGWAQLDAAAKFSSTSINGALVTGTLNRATFQITGTALTSQGKVTFTMQRNASLRPEMAPGILIAPQDQTVALGQKATFSVSASGSAPLCYRWSSNGVPLPKAAASSLVLSNVQFTSAATYSVEVENMAGSTNLSARLTVVPERVVPTLAIVSPSANQRVLTADLPVTGTAADNVKVAQVWLKANAGAWQLGAGTSNWSGVVPLLAGTNVVRAYAVDTSGNLSLTNSVTFVYMVGAPLVVQTVGQGTVTPNLNNQWLELGKKYSLTATAGAGYAFANWSGSLSTNKATLTFVMQPNLVLVATFLDNNPPHAGC